MRLRLYIRVKGEVYWFWTEVVFGMEFPYGMGYDVGFPVAELV